MTEATTAAASPADTSAAAASPATALTAGTAPDAGGQQQAAQAPAPAAAASTAAPGSTEGTAAPGATPEAKTTAAAPEKYQAFKRPDGLLVDPAVTPEVEAVAKKFNLTQEQAQEIVDLDTRRAQRDTQRLQQARTEWLSAAKADKELGGEQLETNIATAKKAIETFGSPQLKALLDATGLGNHPEVIRAFYKVGKAISEDRIVTGGQRGPAGQRDAASVLYPNQPAART